MSDAPRYDIDVAAFWADPYPDLKAMRETAPIAYIPQLGATVLTRREDIRTCEKVVEVFSSDQPDGLMTRLMGQNFMRKDGDSHLDERKAIFPTVSPKTVRLYWQEKFQERTDHFLDEMAKKGGGDLIADYAMPVSAEALKNITGLVNTSWQNMDAWSQAMIDGISNYTGVREIEDRCNAATAAIDACIDDRLAGNREDPDLSLLGVMVAAGLPMETVRANVKLAISGGQNEPRDAIAGAVWALLSHPDQLALVLDGKASWHQAFDEYVRWLAPIGMAPRRVASRHTYGGVTFEPEDRVFLMFSSANHDEDEFDDPGRFDVTRPNATAHIAFGAGPHFCAGAAASRTLVADVALPGIFRRFPNLRLDEDSPVRIGGWAFRGLLTLPTRWD